MPAQRLVIFTHNFIRHYYIAWYYASHFNVYGIDFDGFCMKASILDQLQNRNDVRWIVDDGRNKYDDGCRLSNDQSGRSMRRHGPTATLLVRHRVPYYIHVQVRRK